MQSSTRGTSATGTTWKCARRTARSTSRKINLAEDGVGIKSAFLRVSGFYFQGREAISFNEDGFIGIAGWADDTNVQPFLRAFYRWVCEWMIGVVYR